MTLFYCTALSLNKEKKTANFVSTLIIAKNVKDACLIANQKYRYLVKENYFKDEGYLFFDTQNCLEIDIPTIDNDVSFMTQLCPSKNYPGYSVTTAGF